MSEALNKMAALHQDMANMHGTTMGRVSEVLETLKAPKRIIRGADGRAVAVEHATNLAPVVGIPATRVQ